MSLPRQITRARQRKGLRAAQMAMLLGVTRQAVHNWESGKRPPRLRNLAKIAKLLDTTVAELLGEAA